IILGGAFTQFNDKPHNYVVRLYGGSLAGPGAFQFSLDTYNANEFDGQALITVLRAGGTRGEVQVDYLTSDGTALAGQDYLGAAGTLVFPEGEVKKTFAVPILQDADIEPTETVNLALSNPSPGTRLGLQPTATLNIISDDSRVGFLTQTFSVSEGTPSGR